MENEKPVVDTAQEQEQVPVSEVSEEEIDQELPVSDPAGQLAAVTAERDRLAAEKAEIHDRLLRRQADFENFRRRAEKERSEIFENAGMESVLSLLPILDDLERAISAAPQLDGPAAEFLKGIEIIYQRFLDTLQKLGLEPIEAVGRPFDPNLHHAVETVPSEDREDHTVYDQFQRGYNFRGRLLRAAMVRVAVKPS